MQLSYSDVLFRKLTGLGEVFGTGTAIYNPVPVSPSLGVSRTMGAGRLLLREGPGVKYELSLSFICTENPGGAATTFASIAKTQAYEKWAILGQFSTAKIGRGGAMCSKEEMMVSE